MIISASRRTDIPAFYSEWFFNRLKHGFVYTQNPVNPKQISKIPLNPDTVDCIVFWTKNPKPMLDKLNQLEHYNYYFLFTVTAYERDIEPDLQDKEEIIEIFKKLSEILGHKRLIWRYDPVLCTERYSIEYHKEFFLKLAEQFSGYTDKCIISFFQEYKKCERNMRHINYRHLSNNEKRELASCFARAGKDNGIKIEACAEETDLKDYGVEPSKCIDDELISEIAGKRLVANADKGQRKLCNCITSIDTGAYNTCPHNCVYCYANHNKELVRNNFLKHRPDLPLLSGDLRGDERIYEKETKSLFINNEQMCLFSETF